MAGCCDPQDYGVMFGDRVAHGSAQRYRRRGLDRTARRMVDFLTAQGIAGLTVLEIGGGVGGLHLELLRRGAATATNLELSGAYEEDAAALAAEAGMTGRVRRLTVDVAVSPQAVEPADVVVLHRVVCCYPDHARLLGSAADHARRLLVLSHPRGSLGSRTLVAAENVLHALRGRGFRAFVHPPQAMRETVTSHGHEVLLTHRGPLWEVVGAARRS